VEGAVIAGYYDAAAARGFLIKSARALAWDRYDAGAEHLDRARSLGGMPGRVFEERLAHQLYARDRGLGKMRESRPSVRSSHTLSV
jgi:hypothetical protein